MLVVAHDAGGAEVLSSYVRRETPAPCIYSIAGPALPIFQRKLGAIETLPLEQGIKESDWVLCGTGWQSDLEWTAIALAGAHGKRSVAFLDHWGNYTDRFLRNGVRLLPDEIWVGDPLAEEVARGSFPDMPIRLVPNPYFVDIEEELASLPSGAPGDDRVVTVLYLCEPTSQHSVARYGHAGHWGYDEQDALRYFLSNIAALGVEISRVLIRPHPSEPGDKYAWATDEFDLPLDFSSGRSLVEEVAASDILVGCESMAMVVGLLAGKRVISAVPPGGRPCALPHREIEHLGNLAGSAGTRVRVPLSPEPDPALPDVANRR